VPQVRLWGGRDTLFPDHLLIEVAEHLRAGLYHVVSMNISSSSLVVLCETVVVARLPAGIEQDPVASHGVRSWKEMKERLRRVALARCTIVK